MQTIHVIIGFVFVPVENVFTQEEGKEAKPCWRRQSSPAHEAANVFQSFRLWCATNLAPVTAEEWQVIWFTAWVSALSTLVILPFGIVMAWVLARHAWPGKSVVETLVSLPLVIPPVATGLILLKLLGRRGPVGKYLHETFDLDIVFTWRAVLIALGVMSFPLLVRSVRVAFEQINPRLEQIGRTLGASNARVFFTITLPLAKRGVIAGMLLAFARALGEFGATIMVAGNIPGQTSTLSLDIFQSVQLGHDAHALRMLGISVALAFAAVLASELILKRKRL